jgi:hypothetical protein
MAIKSYKPTTPSRRHMTVLPFDEITKTEPEKSLTVALKRTGGRNAKGRMTVRHRGGGHKRLYRLVDFKRRKDDVPAKVAAIEYDPNRSANIALLHYADGHKAYIIAPNDLKVGDVVVSGVNADIKTGNTLPLRAIPVGTLIHNIELRPGKGGQLVRSAGTVAQLMAKRITAEVSCPTIGIGAGPDCDGQVLVVNDMLGMYGGHIPKFVKKFADLQPVILEALKAYKQEVEAGTFPSAEHCFTIQDDVLDKLYGGS